jgi:hypothetical protein
LAISEEILFYNFANKPALRGWFVFFFTGRGRDGKHGIVPALAPCGSIRAADGAQTYPHGLSRKRLKIGGTQKIL